MLLFIFIILLVKFIHLLYILTEVSPPFFPSIPSSPLPLPLPTHSSSVSVQKGEGLHECQ